MPSQHGVPQRNGTGATQVRGAPPRPAGIPPASQSSAARGGGYPGRPAAYGGYGGQSGYGGPSANGGHGRGQPAYSGYPAPSQSNYAPPPSQLSPAELAAREAAARKQAEEVAKSAELRQILNNLEKVDDEGRRSSLLDTLCSVEDVLELPEHPSPPGVSGGDLKVNLLKHQVRVVCIGDSGLGSVLMRSVQSQALQWCVQREYPVLPKKETDKPVQFWQVKKLNGKVCVLLHLRSSWSN